MEEKKKVIRLQGKTYNAVPYVVAINVDYGRVTSINVTGKACKAVATLANNLGQLHPSNIKDVVNVIKLTMALHNEYVITAEA